MPQRKPVLLMSPAPPKQLPSVSKTEFSSNWVLQGWEPMTERAALQKGLRFTSEMCFQFQLLGGRTAAAVMECFQK